MTRHFRASLRYLPDIDGYYPRFQAILIYVFAREIRISLFYSPPFETESSNLFPFCILHRHQKNFIRLGLLTYFDWIKFKKKIYIKIDNIYTLLPSWKNEKLINKGWSSNQKSIASIHTGRNDVKGMWIHIDILRTIYRLSFPSSRTVSSIPTDDGIYKTWHNDYPQLHRSSVSSSLRIASCTRPCICISTIHWPFILWSIFNNGI